MPYLKIWIHLIWRTKKGHPFLGDKIRKEVFKHIFENARAKDIYIDHINGYVDHVHCLISLKGDQSIARVANLLKGESSFWINKSKLTETKFEWADEYFAASVSHADVERVREYIACQEIHHTRKTFRKEYREFLKENGLDERM